MSRPTRAQLQQRAHAAVSLAVREGRLTRQPCARCGRQPTQGHHHDYSQPLVVEWLCGSCHTREHWRERRKRSIRTITVTLPRETVEQLEEVALAESVPRTVVLRWAIREYLRQRWSQVHHHRLTETERQRLITAARQRVSVAEREHA